MAALNKSYDSIYVYYILGLKNLKFELRETIFVFINLKYPFLPPQAAEELSSPRLAMPPETLSRVLRMVSVSKCRSSFVTFFNVFLIEVRIVALRK